MRTFYLTKSILTGLAAWVLLSLGPGTLLGQSGRRGSNSTPPAHATPTPTPSVVSADPRPAIKVALMVATRYTKKKLATEGEIYTAFIRRLQDFEGVSITPISNLSTDEAIKRAQQQNESYVALLQFEIDIVQDGRLIVNSQNLQVHCYVFEPKTGKRIVKDKTFYQPVGGLGTRTPGEVGSSPVKITTEAAGASAAEQLHGGLVLALRAGRQ